MVIDSGQSSERWTEAYANLLRAYLNGESGEVLEQVSRIGNALYEDRVTPDAVAMAHVACVRQLCEYGSAGGCQVLEAVGPCLMELMRAYGSTYVAQREAFTQLAATVDALPDLMFEVDREGRFHGYRAPHPEQLYAPPEVFLGRTVSEVLPADAATVIMFAIEEAAERGVHRGGAFALDILGKHRWFELSIAPKGDRHAPDCHFVILSRDISDRKRAEEALRRAHDELETRVAERSAALSVANEELRREIEERRRVEDELRESEERYRGILEDQTEMICRWREGFVHTYVNEAYCRGLGVSREQLIGRSFLPYIPEEERPRVIAHFAKLTRENPVAAIEHNVRGPGGEVRRHQWTNRAILNVRGEVVEYQSVGRDITDRWRAERALREREELFRAVVNASKDAMVAIDENALITIFNPAAEKMFGWKRDELIGQPLGLLMPAEFKERHAQYVRQFCDTGMPHNLVGKTTELRAIRKDGESFPIALSLSMGRRGDRVFALAVIRDVSLRKRAEETLRASEEKYRGIFDESIAAIYVFDREKRFVDSNRAGLDLLGYTRDELIGMSVSEVDADPARVLPAHQQLLAGERLVNYEHKLKRKDGRIITVLNNSMPLTDASGNVVGLQSTLLDITDRKIAENELRKFKAVSDKAANGHVIADMNGIVIYSNEAFARQHGYEPSELCGRHLSTLQAVDQTPHINELIERLLRDGSCLVEEVWHKRRDGSVYPTLMSATVIPDDEGRPQFMAATSIDITDRQRVEQALRTSEARYRAVVEDQTELVCRFGPGERLKFVNQAYARFIGRTPEELIGQRCFDHVAESEREGIREALDGLTPEEAVHIREHQIRRSDGSWVWCHWTYRALFDARGWLTEFQAVGRDIDERRRAEEEARQRRHELAHVSRLATMGEMATGLAHELNQPLAAILYYARGCARRLNAGRMDCAEMDEIIEKIAVQAQRAGEFIERMRSFVRKGGPRVGSADLNAIAREAIEFVEHDARSRGVVIEFQPDTSIWPAYADMIQVEQVVLNLMRNGIEAMRETPPEDRRLVLRTWNADQGTVAFSVTDSGPGLPAAHADEVFDAFFSTKLDGMGMGLAISRTLIESQGGRLRVASSSSSGATFEFTLPALNEESRNGQ